MNLRRHHSDYILSLIVFGLVVFGLIMIYSVSKYYSLELTDGESDKIYLTKQAVMVVIGLVAWVVTQAIDYRFWQKYYKQMFFVTIGLLLLPVVLNPTGLSIANRWINLGFSTFQPAELAKLTFIFYLAGFFAAQGENLQNIKKSFSGFLVAMATVSILMLLQKDLGTLSVFVGIGAAIFVTAGATTSQMLTAAGLAGFLAWLAIKFEPYRMQRLLTFLNSDSHDLGAGYHIKNALIAIGSGGLWGLGFGQSKQKYLYLPEAHTDSIFAIICEELGTLRASLVIAAFCFLALRGFMIAKNTADPFGRMVAVAITVWLFLQMFVNIAAMFSMVPLTGIPLPFISYGGTSLVVLLTAIGVLINISKYQTINVAKK
jgi:cell division protein FtsW